MSIALLALGLLVLAVMAWNIGGRVDAYKRDDDWTPYEFRATATLDRAELWDLPYSPVIPDDVALAAQRWIRGLPEIAA